MLRRLIAVPTALLPLCVACSNGTPAGATLTAGAMPLDRGAQLYEANCSACHQGSGLGMPAVYPSLSGSPVVLGDPAQLAAWVIKGVRPEAMPQGRYATAMPQFGWMKPAAAAALLTYVRSSFGNSASAVDAAAVERGIGP